MNTSALDLLGTSWEELWSEHGSHEAVGAVYTRPEIVRLILDLAGYTVESGRLAERRLLEPSCGDGAFLTEVIARLVESERQHAVQIDWDDPVLGNAIRAVDINAASLQAAQKSIVEQLLRYGCPSDRSSELARLWTMHTDFLLADLDPVFDFVVGNPPYVRIEDVPKPVLKRYRQIFETTSDRADLYVAFIERGLSLLSPSGTLAYICANRFAKNAYGRALRRLLARNYHVRHYLNLEHTQPFLTDVSAYPAILVVDRSKDEPTCAATLKDLASDTLETVRTEALHVPEATRIVSRFKTWYPGGEPWTSTEADEQAWLARLCATYPTLEESAATTKVGIGVATGADRVFVLPEKPADIEESRLIPLALASDIANDGVRWSGHYLLNPFDAKDNGMLADLREHPGMARYLTRHEERLRKRHVAKSRPHTWYRTIDRVWPQLQGRAKLLLPDIQMRPLIALDEGAYYPHHNLYWITSEGWDLRALKALLRSTLVSRQIRAYSVQMRGGALRYQAQTLRRVRVPCFEALPKSLVEELSTLADSVDQTAIDRLVGEAFSALGREPRVPTTISDR
jgi:hypothetical protein